VSVVAEWLKSGEVASLDGIELMILSYPGLPSMPFELKRGQASAFVLEDRQSRSWILKKFSAGRDPEIAYVRAIRNLVPHETGFESGSQRRILTSHAVGRGFGTPEFAEWIEKTILMPRVGGESWVGLADMVRDGTITLDEDTRAAMCRSLASCARGLERAGVSHRDLSNTNVFVDSATWNVHFIDWDSLYHPSLALPSHTTVGTLGYTAPFVMTAKGEDARESWRPHADRFAMALLCTEFLMLDRGSPLTHEGGLFEQRDLYARDGPTVRKMERDLTSRHPAIGRLFDRALQARTFAACPSPDEWLAASPLAKQIKSPPLDRQSAMSRFDSYMQKLKEPVPPAPPAPTLPVIDFRAVIRNTLAPSSPAAPPSGSADAEETED
jgi:serine/threonine protein kinase